MVARARELQARVLPHGWLDALRQVSLFGLAYLGYRLVRGLVEGNANEAVAHARDLISLERRVHLFVEPSVQTRASGRHVVMIGWSLARLVRTSVARVAWTLYPFLMTFVIVVTANHFLVDAMLGALTAGASAYGATWLARVRPGAWRFSAVAPRLTASG